MAKSKQRRALPKPVLPHEAIPRTRKRLHPALVIAIAIFVTIAIFKAISLYNDHKAMAGMQAYLQEKYGQEFVVYNYRIEGGGFGVEGYPTAGAYSTNSPNMAFTVWDHAGVGGDSDKHSYHDSYLSALWAREYNHEIKPQLAKLLQVENPDYVALLGIGSETSNRLAHKGPLPTFKEYRQTEENLASIELRVFHPSLKHSDKIWYIIALLKETGAEKLELGVCTNNSKKRCPTLSNETIKSINSIEDMRKYLETNKGGV